MSDYDQEARPARRPPGRSRVSVHCGRHAAQEVKDLRRLMERLDAKLQEAAPETEEARLPRVTVWLLGL